MAKSPNFFFRIDLGNIYFGSWEIFGVSISIRNFVLFPFLLFSERSKHSPDLQRRAKKIWYVFLQILWFCGDQLRIPALKGLARVVLHFWFFFAQKKTQLRLWVVLDGFLTVRAHFFTQTSLISFLWNLLFF